MEKWNASHPRTRLRLAAAGILFLGLAGAAAIYLAAGEAGDGGLGYEPEDSKLYMHDLELYGGKANVLAAEVSRWFAGLWHGRTLAGTVACIAVVVSGVMFWVASHLPSDPRDHDDGAGPTDT